MATFNGMMRIDDIRRAPESRLHPATDEHKAAVFLDLGEHGSQVTLWGYDAAAFRRIAEACTDAARQLDAAAEASEGVKA